MKWVIGLKIRFCDRTNDRRAKCAVGPLKKAKPCQSIGDSGLMDGIHPKMYFPSAKTEKMLLWTFYTYQLIDCQIGQRIPTKFLHFVAKRKKKPFETKESDHPFSNQFSIGTSLIRRAWPFKWALKRRSWGAISSSDDSKTTIKPNQELFFVVM